MQCHCRKKTYPMDVEENELVKFLCFKSSDNTKADILLEYLS